MATITVNSVLDEDDGSILDGDVTLREAINAAIAGDTIVFDSSVFNANGNPLNNTTIVMDVQSAADNSIVLDKDITITGDVNGDGIADVTIDNDNRGRIFEVEGAGTDVVFHGLTLTNASLGAILASDNTTTDITTTVLNSNFIGNTSASNGGAIFSNEALYVANSYFADNSATIGGGAIAVFNSNPPITIVNSTFTRNYASGDGGAIIGAGGSANNITITNSTLTGNRAGGVGGALGNGSSINGFNIENSIIAGNLASTTSTNDAEFSIQSNGHNIFGAGVTGTATGDQIVGAAQFTNLFENAGPVTVEGTTFDAGLVTITQGITPVIGLAVGGLAIDGGDNSDLPSEADFGFDIDGDGTIETGPLDIDANGGLRLVGGTVDIGAAEVQPAPALTVQILDSGGEIDETDGVGAGTVIITRNTATFTALTVNLSSSDTTEAQVLPIAVIPVGAASIMIDLNAIDDIMLDGDQTVTITASVTGFISGSDTTVVTDNDMVTPGNDTLEGTSGADTIDALGGNDSIDGKDGDDVIDGGGDNDTLDGDAGNDTLIGGAGADSIDGGGDVDTADYSGSASTVIVRLDGTAGVGGDAEGDTLINVENLIGSSSRDFLIGDANINTLMGGDSADNLQGGGGADVLDGGEGFDFADYQEVTTTLTIDLITFSKSSSVIQEDTLINMEAYAGAVNAQNIYNGQNGNEYFIAGNLGDKVNGNDGADTLRSEAGNDTVNGGAGSDFIVGGLGDDTLSGGEKDMAVDGFLFQDGHGKDVVTDFELGFDKLSWFSPTINALGDLSLSTSVNGWGLVTYGASTVEVLNVTEAQLNDKDNFFFF